MRLCECARMEYDATNQVVLKNPPWWERRSNLERRVMVLSLLLFLIAIILVIGLAIVLLYNHNNDEYPYPYDYEMEYLREHPNMLREIDTVCLAPGCIHAASTILKYMDRSVDPCQDFYTFACGGFVNETNIPGGESSVDAFSFSLELLQEQLRTVIEDPPKHKNLKPFSLAKKLYDICMDTTSAEVHSLQAIKLILSNLGGWPVLEQYQWNEHNFDWKEALFRFRKTGFDVNHFLSLEVLTDFSNQSRSIFVLDEAVLGAEKYILVNGLEDERAKAYYLYMIDVAVMFGAEWEFAVNEIKTAVEFEIALAKISTLRDVWNGTTIHHSMSILELQGRYPTINWLEYINGIVGIPDFQVSYDDIVVVRSPQYISELEKLLSWTSKRVQANFLMWRAVKSSVQFLTEQLRHRRFDYFAIAFGVTDRASRWKECVNVVTKGLSFAVGSLYVHKYIKQDAREVVFELVANVRNQFMELLKLVDWMDDVTKMNALGKADVLGVRTAYSDEFLSVKNLQNYYSLLDFPRENYLSCILSLNLFERDKYFEKLKKFSNKLDRDEDMYTTTVHPYYDPTKNILNIPSGILQGFFFSTDRPQFLNYGALGYIIGHEIAHGFDSTGRHFDKDGNVQDWWTEYTKKAFVQKSHCLNNDRRNYTLPDIDTFTHDIDTRECNVADNAGIKAAYLAYNMWVERFGHEYQIPSLNYYTPLQLFWIAAAQTKCTKYRPEYLKEQGYTKEHSPTYYKVQAAISNNEFFARDFHCTIGSPMNPVHKCHVW